MARPGGGPENLRPPFSSTNQPKNRGRKPSSIKKYIKANNVNYNDISAMAKYIIPLTQEQITELAKDAKAPFMMRLFARAVLEDMKKGYLDNILKLLDRAVGRPKESHEISGPDGGPIVTRDEKKQRLEELLSKRIESAN